ncbi:PadR family transcriptional regulator [Salinarchaeum sp. IM2453]|uniref:PadR family transcriptional regulator n=1 Tax=Salinarchaeum sp. IM2453 TaxID=2862870 RepID=UPI001C8356FE|nr:PadR family transcriptional regulator [Salinarchaeum sp. IM2453]QZA88951.1 PadR family transcriptional regulator [Salinarchaeum sp. IM2453]
MSQVSTEPSSSNLELTKFQRDILAVLARGPNYGLGLKRELEDRYGGEVNHGRLYPNLNELVDAGYIKKGERDRRTNEYQLTEPGKAALLDDLEWVLENLGATDEHKKAVTDVVNETL